MADPFERDLVALMPHLERFAYSLTAHRERAEDLVQDTCVAALTYREQFTPGTNLKAWVFLICRNQFYTERRRAWRWMQPPVGHNKGGEEVEVWDLLLHAPATQQGKLELDDLLKAMSYLPAAHADAILAVAEGLSYEEAAQEAGVALGTIKSRVSRGRAQLAAYFGLNIIIEETVG